MGLFSRQNGSRDHSPSSDDGHPLEAGKPTSSDHHEGDYRTLTPEPDETTALLLSSDNPDINPYKNFSIRMLRRLTFLFLIFASLIIFLLLISMFFTIPALNTRGGNFLMFANMMVSLGNLGIALFVFNIPSKSERIVNLTMMGLLVLDFILILSVNKLRHFEGGPLGILIMLWTIFTAAWVTVCNHFVERSRRGLEERILGHRITQSRVRRSCRQWCSVMWSLVVFIVLLVLVFLIMLSIAVDSYDSRIAPPGQYVEVEDNLYRVHVYCNRPKQNETEPTIILEAGSTSAEVLAMEWLDQEVEDQGSAIYNYRYCYWDRPGMAFSDNAPSPMSAGMAVDALSDALNQIDEHGPWIPVSHGIGGVYSRIFASRHYRDIYGLVLVDTYHEQYFVDVVGSSGRGFGYWLHGFISPLGIDKQIGWIFGGRSSVDRIYGRSQSVSGKYNLAKFQEQVAARTFTRNEIAASRGILPLDTRIAVISSQDMIQNTEGWADYQRELSQMTTALTEWNIVEAPHEVWRDDEGRRAMSRAVADLVLAFGPDGQTDQMDIAEFEYLSAVLADRVQFE
ncbi:hypothetical protein V1512DRAFT_204014 [Lipomyces arxii]|uniref:uncharacterized protein n=1 Tax=Lipomyces arxii TaxID=56418 RepID=UPI0034CE1F22